MIILGIETSCDETASALVKDGNKIISSVVASQEKIHSKYFGVVPELASRAHLEKINYVIEKTLVAGSEKFDIVAYTSGPGLLGSLLVGQIVASTIGYVRNVPVVPVNHLEGHILSVLFDNPALKPPFLSLIVSGGHTELVIVKKIGQYKVLGRTRDDACGESFDKVAKMLRIGYPGGPKIEKLAKSGGPGSIKFPRPYLWGNWDFSFSGIKTAVLYHLRGKYPDPGEKISRKDIVNVCASFQQAVIDTLVHKTIKCSQQHKLNNIAVAGGVSANGTLRKQFINAVNREKNMKVYFPEIKLSTDNAAMIASAGYYRAMQLKKENKLGKGFSFSNNKVNPDLELD